MKATVIDIKGNKVKDIELDDEVFALKPNKSSIYEAIKNELANKRQGTSSVKTKAEVAGSGTKPWKQKGTGRARVGTKRNPVWTGGGVAFGPKPRDFSYKLPKKIKKLAYRSIFSQKLLDSNLVILDKIPLENAKTKEFLAAINPLIEKKIISDRISLILNEKENNVYIASKNIPWVKNLNCDRLNAHDLYYSEKVVVTEESLMRINDNLKIKD